MCVRERQKGIRAIFMKFYEADSIFSERGAILGVASSSIWIQSSNDANDRRVDCAAKLEKEKLSRVQI